jgi:hypothetical protein
MDVQLEIMCTLRCMQDVHTQKSLGGQFRESRWHLNHPSPLPKTPLGIQIFENLLEMLCFFIETGRNPARCSGYSWCIFFLEKVAYNMKYTVWFTLVEVFNSSSPDLSEFDQNRDGLDQVSR